MDAAPASDPPTSARIPTRQRILESTARLTVEKGGGEVSVAEIARSADVFPNQITYHFGSKDSLLVQAAFLALLHDAERIERVGRQAADAAAFRKGIARVVLALPSLPAVARALAAGIAQPPLAPVIDRRVQLLFVQSERYLRRLRLERGWVTERDPGVEARTFWSAALGATLLSRAGVSGSPADLDLAGTLTIREPESRVDRAGQRAS
ncbi:TetR/AcrR family transcriptional regulator C-terminal domain-containing protein [Microbacterium timonense]|uniref:TetR/AcrR family transcriptional regulator C-terminal domain-containing protein n=1 Tax=Microbacterium timonense TaxID=2086576 RepID=UPI000D10C7F9|nr:TetR/AcrR family transcriptional regulator C-terminal domain-containing protein [Microbacterium timonense]